MFNTESTGVCQDGGRQQNTLCQKSGMLMDWLTESCGLEVGMRLWVGDTFDSCVVRMSCIDKLLCLSHLHTSKVKMKSRVKEFGVMGPNPTELG